MDQETARVFKVCRMMVCSIIFMGIILGPDGAILAVVVPLVGGAIAGAYQMHGYGGKFVIFSAPLGMYLDI